MAKLGLIEKEKLDKLIFTKLHKQADGKPAMVSADLLPGDTTIVKFLKDHHVSKQKFKDVLSQHYYLSPRNLLRAQILLALLCATTALSLASVRIGTDLVVVAMLTGIGALVGCPYILFYYLLKRARSWKNFWVVCNISFSYTLLVAALFSAVCLLINVVGVILIPLAMCIFFFIELRKLDRLHSEFAKLKSKKSSNLAR